MRAASKIFVLLILFLATGYFVSAQVQPNGTAWKKLVARDLDVQQNGQSKDSTLMEIIFEAFKAGKITAYSNFDHNFTTKLTIEQFDEMWVGQPDTVVTTDPITRKKVTKVIDGKINFNTFHNLRILEEWTFNPSTGNTEIHIEGVAPITEVYTDGKLRGYLEIFWVHYNELLPILDHYEQYHPNDALALHIWNDYFYSDAKPTMLK